MIHGCVIRVRTLGHLDDGVAQHPHARDGCLWDVGLWHVDTCAAQVSTSDGAPVFDQLILVRLARLCLGLLFRHAVKLCLVALFLVVAVRLVTQVVVDRRLHVVVALGELAHGVVRVDVPLELAVHLVERFGREVRVVVPHRHHLEERPVQGLRNDAGETLLVDLDQRPFFGDSHRTRHHAAAVQHP